MDHSRLSPNHSYSQIFERNIGFITPEQQERLRNARILILGVGGMGGAALQTLVRSGVGRFTIADPDTFEIHNLNRQVFSSVKNLGLSKVESTREQILTLQPEAVVKTFQSLSGDDLRSAIREADVVMNGCDDPRATLELHRYCQLEGKTAIDALAATLPNVVVCPPGAGGIEALLKSPLRGKSLSALGDTELALHVQAELRFVMVHSSSAAHVVPEIAAEFMRGKRKRFSFAPMVIGTGNLMANEALAVLLGQRSDRSNIVYFLNSWTRAIERPRRGLGIMLGYWRAYRFLRRTGLA